jgi:nitrous-oxide reductase
VHGLYDYQSVHTFTPDNIEGVKMGDVFISILPILSKDWDMPHGFAVKGANNAELLGHARSETQTLAWRPETHRHISLFTAQTFCSALHQEMQGYIRSKPCRFQCGDLIWYRKNR